MSDLDLERQREKRRQQTGRAVLMCTRTTRATIFQVLLDDLQGQVEEAQNDGADDEDGEVKTLRSMIDASFVTMKAERIKPTAQWQAHFDAKVAAEKQTLERRRENVGSARRKKESDRDYADREAEHRRRKKRPSDSEPPTGSA